jgi:hypothetical protein
VLNAIKTVTPLVHFYNPVSKPYYWQVLLLPIAWLKSLLDELFDWITTLVFQDIVENNAHEIPFKYQFYGFITAIFLALLFYQFPDLETVLVLACSMLGLLEYAILTLFPQQHFSVMLECKNNQLKVYASKHQVRVINLKYIAASHCKECIFRRGVLTTAETKCWQLWLEGDTSFLLATALKHKDITDIQKKIELEFGIVACHDECTDLVLSGQNPPLNNHPIVSKIREGGWLLFALIIANILSKFGVLLMFWLSPLLGTETPQLNLDFSAGAILTLLTPESDYLAIGSYTLGLLFVLWSWFSPKNIINLSSNK